MNQELIDKLVALDIPTSVAQDQNDDPYTLLEKINYAIKLILDNEKTEGSQVKVAGIFQKFIDFIDDPQNQINNLTDAVALNIEGIAHMNEIKQDKLSQVDLDNIASINQLGIAVENNTNAINNLKPKQLYKNDLILNDNRGYCLINSFGNMVIMFDSTSINLTVGTHFIQKQNEYIVIDNSYYEATSPNSEIKITKHSGVIYRVQFY